MKIKTQEPGIRLKIPDLVEKPHHWQPYTRIIKPHHWQPYTRIIKPHHWQPYTRIIIVGLYPTNFTTEEIETI